MKSIILLSLAFVCFVYSAFAITTDSKVVVPVPLKSLPLVIASPIVYLPDHHFSQVRRWCLCEEAPEAHHNDFRYVIEIDEQPGSKVNDYVVELLRLLSHTEIIDEPTASLILTTFSK